MITLPTRYLELEAIFNQTLARGIRTLVVTSPGPGEGVTTLAVALARRHAESGTRTLLVDLNLHHPTLHELFALSRSPWCPGTPSALEVFHPGGMDNLSILAAPSDPEAARTAREPTVMQQTLTQWLEKFGAVIIAASPVLAVNQRNIPAERLGAVCQSVILVVESGRTQANALHGAMEKLREAKAPLAGTVMNDRHSPHLSRELVRETHRFDRWFPHAMERLRHRIRISTFLNQVS